MNLHMPSPTFNSVAEMRAHYAGVKARLSQAPAVSPRRPTRETAYRPRMAAIPLRQPVPVTGPIWPSMHGEETVPAWPAAGAASRAETDVARLIADMVSAGVPAKIVGRTAAALVGKSPAPPEQLPLHERRDAILAEVARRHEIRLAELASPVRTQPVVEARQEACWRLRVELGMSLPAIGRRLNRDHTTVMHAIRRHQARMAANG